MTIQAQSTPSPTSGGGGDTPSDTGATTASSSSTTESRETGVVAVDNDENTQADGQGQENTPTTKDATIDLTTPTKQKESVATTNFEALSDERRQEWSLVLMTKYVKIGQGQGKSSPVYDHIHQILVNFEKILDDEPEDFVKKNPVLQKVESDEYMCCMLCKAKGKALEKCLIKMKPGTTSNGTKHLKEKHPNELAEAKNDRDKSNVKKRKNSTLLTSPVFQFKPKKPKVSAQLDLLKKEATQKLDALVFKFVNNAALPDSTVTNKNFRDVIDFCIENAKDLKDYVHMSRRKFVTIQFASFDELIDVVKKLLAEIRGWYVTNTGARRPFIVVTHDVWDGKKKKINGVSIILTHPNTLETYRIPIALAPPLGETAIELSESNMMGLERVGVQMKDLSTSVNDNCNTAVKAGRLTIGRGRGETGSTRAEDVEDGRCDMHLASLAAGLALSFVERKSDGKVINYWAPFRDLYKKMKSMMSHLFDKKHKGRFKRYKVALDAINQVVINVSLPNSTRVAGALLLMQSCLRSCHALKYYATQDPLFRSKGLTASEWRLLAQFEAVIRPAMNYCFTCQGNRVETAGEMVLSLVALLSEYEDDDMDEYDVVDVDAGTEWEATTQFRNLPTKRMTISAEKAQSQSDISLMSEHAKVLRERYVDAFDEYFTGIPNSRLLAMVINPLLAIYGFDEMEIWTGDEDAAQGMKNRAMMLLKERLMQYRPPVKEADGSEEDDDAAAEVSIEEENSGPLSNRQEKRKKARMAKAKKKSTRVLISEDQIDHVVEAFMNQSFNAKEQLKAQMKRLQQDTKDIQWKKIDEKEDFDILYTSSKFDLCEWWLSVGRKAHPMIYNIVPAIIAEPGSNDFQERTFSACTNFDDSLRQSMKEGRFEMAVLLAVNEALLKKNAVADEKKVNEIINSVIELFQFDAAHHLGIDMNAENLVVED